MKLKINNRKVFIDKIKVCNEFEKISGLMFIPREKAQALLFNFDENQRIAIHSFFVFFSFVALWLDEKNKILDARIVKPFTPFVFSKKNSSKLVEIPFNKKYKKIIELLVGN